MASIGRFSLKLPIHCLFSRNASRFLTNAVNQTDFHQPNASTVNDLSIDFLKEVAKESERKGNRVVLPVADLAAMQKIVAPLSDITKAGVSSEILKDILTSNSDLFVTFSKNGKHCLSILQTLVDFCNFTYEEALKFLSVNLEEINVLDHKDIRDRLNLLGGIGIVPGIQVQRLIMRCPEFIYVSNSNKISIVIDSLLAFFPKKNLIELILGAPQVLLKPFEETALKYEYIYYHMGVEPEKLAKSYDWVDLDLNEIMMRHDFLRKAGKYKTPDPKKPQYEMMNPPIYRIFDTNDMAFANEVADMTEEEWNVFKEMYTKLKALEDKDQPYERVRVSLRKKIERKIKETEHRDDYYIDH